MSKDRFQPVWNKKSFWLQKIKDLVSADQITASTRTSNQKKKGFVNLFSLIRIVLPKEGSDVCKFIFPSIISIYVLFWQAWGQIPNPNPSSKSHMVAHVIVVSSLDADRSFSSFLGGLRVYWDSGLDLDLKKSNNKSFK